MKSRHIFTSLFTLLNDWFYVHINIMMSDLFYIFFCNASHNKYCQNTFIFLLLNLKNRTVLSAVITTSEQIIRVILVMAGCLPV